MKAFSLASLASSVFFCAFASQAAHAQAKPAEKLVTRDELRVCMNSEAELADRRKAFDGRIAKNKEEAEAIRAERAQLAEEEKTLEENQTKMDRFARKVKAHNVKVQAVKANQDAFNADLDALNKSMVAYNDKCGGITYSSTDKEAILKEREAAKK